ncbi:hypothetical protein FRC10_002437 [Ceratobasidium sp. 414]|nr:hypothetical protein FRC10_002437 [Ceratobasidium sp. 414]
MPLPGDQQKAAERVFDTIYTHKVKGRLLSEMFKELPDRATWADYYKIIPEPRALKNIKEKLEKGKYKTAEDLHSDLELVFANAIHFNEEHSVISHDARTLQGTFKKEWTAAVAAGTLPKIEDEIDKPEAPSNPTARQPSRSSRTRDVAPPLTPSIRLPKKVAPATPIISRNATLTPAPQRVGTPQHQQPAPAPAPQQVLAPQPVPAAIAAPRPIQPIVSPTASTPVPAPAATAAPGEVDEDGTAGLVRDKQGDELVQQLEATFPRCPGPGVGGWMEFSEAVDPAEKYMAVLNEIREFKDSGGDRAVDVLECLPDETTNKALPFDVCDQTDKQPATITNRSKDSHLRFSNRAYPSPKEFDMDMSCLFEKARRWHEEGTYSYGRVLVLQCLWHNLTSSKQEEMQVDVTSPSASTPGAPSSATFKGVTYNPGDWVHLANKEIPSKPIVAQVQKIEGATRSFWEREVFKTGYTTSNSLQEIIEPIACQFLPKHIRGRPSPPAWYPGRPLYVCESRYDASSKSFSKIKNWSTCIPDGIRKPAADWEYMPIKKFSSSKPVVPRKHPSPFLKGAALLKKRGGGPGGSTTLGPQKDRSIATAAGGPAVVQASIVDVLPEETVKHFDRDPHTNQLLWFSGAPIDTPRAHARQPRHSLDYLYFLARQRERQHRGEDVDESRRKAAVVPPLSVELASLYREVFESGGGEGRAVEVDQNGDVEMGV